MKVPFTVGGAAPTTPAIPPVTPEKPTVQPVNPPPVIAKPYTISEFYASAIDVGVKLGWPAAADALGFRLYRSTAAGTEGVSITDFYIVGNEFVDVNVEQNTTYYYSYRRVLKEATAAGDMEVLSDPSKQVPVTTLATLLGGGAKPGEAKKKFILMAINDPYMSVDGKQAEIDPGRGTTPGLVSDRTLVPIRAIVEALGGTVGWDGGTKEITLALGGNKVQMWLNSKNISVNGAGKTMDIAPQIINERTLLPIRFAAENLGCQISWINSTKQIVIVY